MSQNIEDLFKRFAAEADEVEKTASEGSDAATEATTADEDTMDKLAEDLQAAGREFGEAAVSHMIEKLAAGVPAGGRGIAIPEGPVHATAKKIGLLKGEAHAPGDDTSVRAEEDGAISGNPAPVVNPQRNLPKAGA